MAPTVHPPENLEAFRALAAEADLVAVCHASYLINLAGTDQPTVERSEAVLAHRCARRAASAALAVIVHLGSHLGSGFDAGLERAAPVLERVLELAGDGTWLLLENTAGAGGTMGLTVDELALVIDRCGRHPWLGVCLDSCHLFASGIDVGDAAALDATLDELDAPIGLDRLKALHINDSQMPLGSNRDRHANVGEGLIGERLSAFLGRPRLQGLPAVLETLGTTARAASARHAAARAPLAPGRRRLRMRVAVVDPQAYTPPYDDELCRALAAAGAEVELLTAHFTHGEAPVAARLRAPRDLRAAARGPDRAPPLVAARGSRSRPPGTRSASPGSSAACAPGAPDIVHWQWAPLPALDLRALRAAGRERRRDGLHGARRAAAALARRGAAVGRALRELRPRDRARRGQPRPPARRGRRRHARAHRGDPARAAARRTRAPRRAASRPSRASSSSA